MAPPVKILPLTLIFTLLQNCICTQEHLLEGLPARQLVSGSTDGFYGGVTLHKPDTLGRWTTRFHEVRLYGGIITVGQYYARIKIGGQTVRVQIVMSSAALAVSMSCKMGDMRYDISKSDSGQATIISCSGPECGGDRCSRCSWKECRLNRSRGVSNTCKCAFCLNFWDGSGESGVLVKDVVEWGDVKFPVVFGGVRQDACVSEGEKVEGILGMAHSRLACNPSCVKSPFEAARDHLKLKDMFTICMTDTGGKITLGAYDSRMATTNVTWVPMRVTSSKTFYSMLLLGNLQIGERELVLPSYGRAIVDAGTSLIVFSRRAFLMILQHLQKYYCHIPHLCSQRSWFRPAHCLRIKDEDRLKLPTLLFRLENFNVTLNASEYMIKHQTNGPDFWCVGLMAIDPISGGADIVFGNVLMKKYITVYDRAKDRIGFAESGGSCEPTST